MADIALLLLLILINGFFSMAEIAMVSSRKARLQRLAGSGRPGAQTALMLHNEPSRFLSAIQVGITSMSILSGAIGEAVLTDPLAGWLRQFSPLAPYARGMALTIVVVGLTYFSVVIGELVPKRLALLAPERIAALIARPMNWFARTVRPLAWLFTVSSDVLLRPVRARRKDEPPVTDEEIDVLMEQGAEAGVFHESEQEIVSNVLRLDEQRIMAIMTHRNDIYRIDLTEPEEAIRRRIAESAYTRIIVSRGGPEHIVGVLRSADLLKSALEGAPLDVEAHLRPPLYVPEGVTTTHLLENFRRARAQCALVVDEYGELKGMVTLTDVLTAIVGDLPSSDAAEEQDMTLREDGSWLVDGSVPVERFKAALHIAETLPGEAEFNTLGGFVMHALGRLPVAADYFEWNGWRLEVVAMDRKRVDKVLVARIRDQASGISEQA